MNLNTGAIHDLLDPRDYNAEQVRQILQRPMNEIVGVCDVWWGGMAKKKPPIENQFKTPSCVACSTTRALELLHPGTDFDWDVLWDAAIEADVASPKEGMRTRDCLKVLKTIGLSDKKTGNEYNFDGFAYVPWSLDSIMRIISKGLPIICSFSFPMSAMDEMDSKGYMNVPDDSSKGHGAHMMTIEGFNRSQVTPFGRGYLYGANSWGYDFGENGYYKLPFEQWKNAINYMFTIYN